MNNEEQKKKKNYILLNIKLSNRQTKLNNNYGLNKWTLHQIYITWRFFSSLFSLYSSSFILAARKEIKINRRERNRKKKDFLNNYIILTQFILQNRNEGGWHGDSESLSWMRWTETASQKELTEDEDDNDHDVDDDDDADDYDEVVK